MTGSRRPTSADPAAAVPDPSARPPGRHAVVTRDEDPEEGRLGRALRARGVPVLHWPTTAILPPEDPSDLQSLPLTLPSYDWVVFTSRNGVEAVADALGAAGSAGVSAEGPRVAVVGQKTAEAARAAGWTPDVVGEGTGATLARTLAARLGDRPARVLLPTTPRAADTVPDVLEAAGHAVHRIEAYRTGLAGPDPVVCRDAIEGGRVGEVTFTSPSAVEGLARALPAGLLERLVRTSVAVAIGPTTAEAVAGAGWRSVQAADTSLEAVAEAAVRLLRAGPGGQDG